MLQKLGTKLINQANNTDALKKVGEDKDVNSLRDAINQVFDELGPSEYNTKRLNEIVQKAKQLLDIVKENIVSSKGSKNFDIDDMHEDKATVQDIIFRIESIRVVHTDQLKQMNDLYNKHNKLKKLINGKL